MAKYKVTIKNSDESYNYNLEGERRKEGLFLGKFNFIIKNEDALIIENSIPITNKIPLKLNSLLSFTYISEYGKMILSSKLLEFYESEDKIYIKYNLYNKDEIVGEIEITILYIK
ncbi:MAG: hypothetical protein SO253_02900 [Bacilli bacterium]|nr:hypothetical protein [Bacilli bacterium]